MWRGWTSASRFSAAAALALAGCFAVARLAAGPRGFDHAAHLGRDLACADCHADAATAAARPSLPALSVCADCHDPATEPRAFTPPMRPVSYSDVKFPHGRHAGGAKIECARCHEGAATGPRATPAGPMRMDACIDCHKERGARTDCAACHEKLGKDVKPANHRPPADWTLAHGSVSRLRDPGAPGERCEVCHARADCDRCHTANAPRDHGNAWRVATHGLAASMDRSRCMACHQSDSCDRCHRTEPPRSHRAGWGAPQERHCLGCHTPVAGESCAVCHGGTPSHAFASPKPAWHTAGMNCRQCHGAGAPMPHVDSGADCNTCHQ